MEIERIDKILEKVLKDLNYTIENRNMDITVIWPRILDKTLRGKSYVLKEKEGYLYVKVEGSCYLAILRLHKKKILEKLYDYGFKYKDIKFVI